MRMGGVFDLYQFPFLTPTKNMNNYVRFNICHISSQTMNHA